MEATHSHDHAHESASLQTWLKPALLLGLGLYFGYIILSGNLTNYINVRFAWLSYVAAGLFLLLGVTSAYQVWRGGKLHSHDHHHDHQHGQLSWPVLAVVAIPLVLGTLIPSEPLGASAVGGNISLNVVAVDNVAGFTRPPKERNVLDWLRAFNQSASPAAFNGQEADVIGFVYREPSFPENTFMLARYTISCCVADASAIGLPVYAEDADSIAADQWVRVQGAFEAGAFRGGTVPILRATALDPIERPEHPYLYP